MSTLVDTSMVINYLRGRRKPTEPFKAYVPHRRPLERCCRPWCGIRSTEVAEDGPANWDGGGFPELS